MNAPSFANQTNQINAVARQKSSFYDMKSKTLILNSFASNEMRMRLNSLRSFGFGATFGSSILSTNRLVVIV